MLQLLFIIISMYIFKKKKKKKKSYQTLFCQFNEDINKLNIY